MTITYPISAPSAAPMPCMAQNHAIVIDVSQSMTADDWRPSRLEAAVDASMAYIAQLARADPSSSVSVVCFSDAARVLCHWTEVRCLRDLSLLRATWLDACRAFGLGDTAMGEGLREALLLVAARNGTTQVVLLTDGHHNTGPDPLEVALRLKALATVVAVGIGGHPSDVDQELLETLASPDANGRPRFRWIGDRGALVAHFEKLAGRLARD